MIHDSLILLSVKHEFNKLFFVIREPKDFVTSKELKLITDTRDHTTSFHLILSRKSSGRFLFM